MATRKRLDAELVRRGLARSRADARERIAVGEVRVAGIAATKADSLVDPQISITLVDVSQPSRVSRGGNKLQGALADLGGPLVRGAVALDAGASTGGFTEVLLEQGADRVFAVDVGYGQLAWKLRVDPRVSVFDRTNIRDLDPARLPMRPTLLVADLSFISLRTVLPAISSLVTSTAQMLFMVKPQFEVGRENVGRRGVVTDPSLRADAVRAVAVAAGELGYGVQGVVASRFPGPAGNVEYFLWLHRQAPELSDADLRRAVEEGPQ